MQSSRISSRRILALISASLAVIFVFLSCHQQPETSTANVASTAPGAVTCAAAANPTSDGGGGPTSVAAVPVPVPTAIDSTCAQSPYTLGSAKFLNTEGQLKADIYSWLTFVSLNWPVNPATCTPDTNISILKHPNNPTWLTYLNDDSVYTSGDPAAWCQSGLPRTATNAKPALFAEHPKLTGAAAKLAQEHPEVTLVLMHNSKGHEMISTVNMLGAKSPDKLKPILQSTELPLVDQNGRFVRYSISMNKEEYDYVVQQKLYTASGQKATPDIAFPSSSEPTPVGPTQLGAMEIKAAWKVLNPAEKASGRYFMQQAIVYNDASGNTLAPGENPVTVGLVGLHIAHKVGGQPQWVWSTFEQIDNNTASFFNPNCKPTIGNHNCELNTPTANATSSELGPTGAPLNAPAQVTELIPRTNPGTDAQFQALLAGTPWQFFRLDGTQWSNGAIGSSPRQIGNSVQETFVTLDGKRGPYSCIACHGFATAEPGGQRSDQSFLVTAVPPNDKK